MPSFWPDTIADGKLPFNVTYAANEGAIHPHDSSGRQRIFHQILQGQCPTRQGGRMWVVKPVFLKSLLKGSVELRRKPTNAIGATAGISLTENESTCLEKMATSFGPPSFASRSISAPILTYLVLTPLYYVGCSRGPGRVFLTPSGPGATAMRDRYSCLPTCTRITNYMSLPDGTIHEFHLFGFHEPESQPVIAIVPLTFVSEGQRNGPGDLRFCDLSWLYESMLIMVGSGSNPWKLGATDQKGRGAR
ncbi:hypothetical protein GGS21DRAFT_183044 [Xylaria nigripes]|nr:hypothetical protein GGS21DRAFT_183044 [Xylaria nigripes]